MLLGWIELVGLKYNYGPTKMTVRVRQKSTSEEVIK